MFQPNPERYLIPRKTRAADRIRAPPVRSHQSKKFAREGTIRITNISFARRISVGTLPRGGFQHRSAMNVMVEILRAIAGQTRRKELGGYSAGLGAGLRSFP